MLVWSRSLANSTSALVHGSTPPQQVWVIFYRLFGVISDEIWKIIKPTTLYQLPGYKTLELVVESEPIFNSDYYDPISIPGSSNPVMVEEKTYIRAWEQRPSGVPVHNIDVDVNVDEDEEDEEWTWMSMGMTSKM
jgi:hypothetical protein